MEKLGFFPIRSSTEKVEAKYTLLIAFRELQIAFSNSVVVE